MSYARAAVAGVLAAAVILAIVDDREPDYRVALIMLVLFGLLLAPDALEAIQKRRKD